MLALMAFARCVTRVDTAFAGRVSAAYGRVYTASPLAWLWAVEGQRPDRWNLIGAALGGAGAVVILFPPRTG